MVRDHAVAAATAPRDRPRSTGRAAAPAPRTSAGASAQAIGRAWEEAPTVTPLPLVPGTASPGAGRGGDSARPPGAGAAARLGRGPYNAVLRAFPLQRTAARLPTAVSDRELLDLFRRDPSAAWCRFLDRYASFMLAELRRLSLNHDAAMDGFVYVCEKLAEGGFRRLRAVRRLGDRGELVPWLRTVVRNLATNWVWSREGRKRLLKSVAVLRPRAQRVFQLYFWQGLRPSEVLEELRRQGDQASPIEVFDILEELFSMLSETRVWHLVSGLARQREPVSLDSPTSEEESPPEPAAPGPDPEEALIHRQAAAEAQRALDTLPARDRLIVQLRYEAALAAAEIAAIVGLDPAEVEERLRAVRSRLRDELVRPEAVRPERGDRRAAEAGG